MRTLTQEANNKKSSILKRNLRMRPVKLHKNNGSIKVIILPNFICDYLEAKNNTITKVIGRAFRKFGFKDATY